MARFKDKDQAIKLRKQGNSYSQIKRILGVSKSTLSIWLREYPLSEKRLRELRDWNETRIERFRQTMRHKKEKRLQSIYSKQSKRWLPLSKRELYLAGLFLYWGEGRKGLENQISITNTDPKVIKFALHWMTKLLNIPKRKITVYLHLYRDMNIKKEINFWKKQLGIPNEQFRKPYIKKSLSANINHGGYGHGTCKIQVGDVRLKEKIMLSLRAITDYY